MNDKEVCITIGGSHPTSEAGIQADLKCANFWNVYSSSVVTTVTAQNKHHFLSTTTSPNQLVQNQLQAILNIFEKPYVKIGMITSERQFEVIESFASSFKFILYDPIMRTTTNKKFLINMDKIKSFITSYCDFITPNYEEFKILSNKHPRSQKDLTSDLKEFSSKYNCEIFLKGGHSKDVSTDFFIDKNQNIYSLFLPPLHNIRASHGTGCKIAMSILSNLAKGSSVITAVKKAKSYVYSSLVNPLKIQGEWMMGNGKDFQKFYKELVIEKL